MSPASSAVTTATARLARRIDVSWVQKPRELITRASSGHVGPMRSGSRSEDTRKLDDSPHVNRVRDWNGSKPALVIDGDSLGAPGISIDRRSQSFLGIVGVPALSSGPRTFPQAVS